MNDAQTIKKLAELFHIAPSALRYWDNEGLIRFERCQENNYRTPTWKTMMDISEVLLNRSLSIPVKAIRELPKMSVEQQLSLLMDSEDKLKEQIKEIQTTLERIDHKRELLETADQLNERNIFTLEEVKLPSIRPFSFESKLDMQQFIYDPSSSAVLLTDGQTCLYGMFTVNDEDVLYREADIQAKTYLKGLLKINSNDDTQSNRSLFYEEAKRRQLKAGCIIGRYLVSAYDEERCDYYEAWLEILA